MEINLISGNSSGRRKIFVREGNYGERGVNVDKRGRMYDNEGNRLIEVNGRLESFGKDMHPELNSW